VALAEVAQRKSDSPEVKQFAEMMKTQHTEANQQLQPLAQARGISINQSLDPKHQQKVEKFQKLGGNEFDQEYAKAMLRDHQKNIALYERAAQQLQDPDVRRYAQNTLPKLQQHLQHAEQTARSVGIDQTTITSILHESPDAMGGAVDKSERHSGNKEVDKQ